MLLASVASADPSSITTGPYKVTFDLNTPMNYTVEITPPFEGGNYTSYSVLINVSNVANAGVYIFDLKKPEDATIAKEYAAYTHDLNNSSVEISKIDGKDGVIARYVSPKNRQVLQGIYWLDSNKTGNGSLSEGSKEVRIYAVTQQNSTESLAIAENLINSLHIEKAEAQTAGENRTSKNQTAKIIQAIGPAVQAIRPEPYLRVRDQNVEDNHGYAIIEEALSNGPGWIVIYNEKYPYSRPYIQPVGYTHVDDGLSMMIKVRLNMALVTNNLYAILFKDDGHVGAFEYPGQDFPLNPRAVKIYSFSSKWPNPLEDFNIDWRNHTSFPGSDWL